MWLQAEPVFGNGIKKACKHRQLKAFPFSVTRQAFRDMEILSMIPNAR